MFEVLPRVFGALKKQTTANPPVLALIHEEDEMYLFFTTHPDLKDTPAKSYIESGEGMLDCLNQILIKAEFSFNQIGSFLEFACGFGRFTRHLITKLDSTRIVVADISQKAVDFQKKTFGVKGFYSKSDPEELYIPGQFDVIFVASLFSHLPRKNWANWIKKLYSALNKGGLLIFSTHGPSCMQNQNDMPDDGFLFLEMSESKNLSFEEYGTTYVTNNFVTSAIKNVTRQNIEFMIEKYLWNYQDVYVVRRPGRNINKGLSAISGYLRKALSIFKRI